MIISEESGKVSIAVRGELSEGLDRSTFVRRLSALLADSMDAGSLTSTRQGVV